MSSEISASTAAYYNSLSISKSGTDWIASTVTAIKNSQQSAGILGALANSGDGSVSSFLSQSSAFAGNFATIAQTSVTNSGSFYAQIASANQQQAAQQKLQDQLDALNATPVQPKSLLDPVIYLGDGTTIDTTSNVMTLLDGTKIDVTTGVKVVDPASIIQMANGAYLDTANNILTLSDGTRIDTVTGLKLSTTA
jgi:hypothetical protein